MVHFIWVDDYLYFILLFVIVKLHLNLNIKTYLIHRVLESRIKSFQDRQPGI